MTGRKISRHDGCSPHGQHRGRTCRAARRQPGVILAAVLVGLIVVLMVGGALTQGLVLHHRQLRQRELSQQSFWLAESALQRAVQRLADSPDYAGETWRVPGGAWGGGHDGVAIIAVQPLADSPDLRRITVQAAYPEHPPDRVLHLRHWDVPLSSDAGASP